MENNDFLKQFGGSATANVLTIVVVMIYKFIEGRCKHSRCSSNTSCFKCETDNYSTQRGGSSDPRVKENAIQPESSVSEMPSSKHSQVQEGHTSTIKVVQPESSTDSREIRMVKTGELV